MTQLDRIEGLSWMIFGLVLFVFFHATNIVGIHANVGVFLLVMLISATCFLKDIRRGDER